MKTLVTAPMLVALHYVAKVGVVKAWPDDIKDGTIRQLRRHGLVETDVTSWNVHPGSNVNWSSIRDRLSEKGKLFLKTCRDCRGDLKTLEAAKRGQCSGCANHDARLRWQDKNLPVPSDHPTRDSEVA